MLALIADADMEGAPAAIATAAPHFVQNFVAAARVVPHFVQNRRAAVDSLDALHGEPHFVQKASRSARAAPHCLQLSGIAASALVHQQKRTVAQPIA